MRHLTPPLKRSEINRACREARACFQANGWTLPPSPQWDVTDFGLGEFSRHGLVLINLAAEPEYCEKLMYARQGQATPCHTHVKKKEDIICRAGELTLALNSRRPEPGEDPLSSFSEVSVRVNGIPRILAAGQRLVLPAGWRVTLTPGIWHAFWPSGGGCVIGEVSTANDDLHDNIFADSRIGRFPRIEEDEPAWVRLAGEEAMSGAAARM